MTAEPQQSDPRVDVLAVIRAPLEQYPPSVYQVALLAEAGLRVAVVDLAHPRCPPTAFGTDVPVRRLHAARHTLSLEESFPSAPVRFWRALQFTFRTRRALRRLRPKVVIAYDAQACSIVGRVFGARSRARLICHIHDLPATRQTGQGMSAAFAQQHYLKVARRADLVIHPDEERARVFMELAGLTRRPVTVMNCPRLVPEIPASTLMSRIGGSLPPDARTVFFQGWIGADRGLEKLMESMKYWPANAVLILVGPVSPQYRESLLQLAAAANRPLRVIFIPMVPLAELAALTVGADLAWGAFPPNPDDLNFKYMAGASNKRFMYMALGVAQIANKGPGMSELIEHPRCGLLVDPENIAEVGKAVHLLLTDDGLRREMGYNGRTVHRSGFNYEAQFAPVLTQILAWTKT